MADAQLVETIAAQNSQLSLELIRLSDKITDQLRHIKTACCYLEQYRKNLDAGAANKATMALALAEEALQRMSRVHDSRSQD